MATSKPAKTVSPQVVKNTQQLEALQMSPASGGLLQPTTAMLHANLNHREWLLLSHQSFLFTQETPARIIREKSDKFSHFATIPSFSLWLSRYQIRTLGVKGSIANGYDEEGKPK